MSLKLEQFVVAVIWMTCTNLSLGNAYRLLEFRVGNEIISNDKIATHISLES